MVNRNKRQEEQTVIFLHLPKTAGTTLIRILEKQYRPEDVYSIVAPQDFQDLVSLSEARIEDFVKVQTEMDKVFI